VIVTDCCTPALVAVIVVIPSLTAVIVPIALFPVTVATPGELDDHATAGAFT
jgi:hypothetical protein